MTDIGTILIDGSNVQKGAFRSWLSAIELLTRPQVDVFLIGGQSNAVGHGSSASSPVVPAGKVLQWVTGNITDANDPVGGRQPDAHGIQ